MICFFSGQNIAGQSSPFRMYDYFGWFECVAERETLCYVMPAICCRKGAKSEGRGLVNWLGSELLGHLVERLDKALTGSTKTPNVGQRADVPGGEWPTFQVCMGFPQREKAASRNMLQTAVNTIGD